MDPTEGEDPVRWSHWSAGGARDIHELLQALATSHHVNNAAPDLNNELLREDDPWAEFWAESVPA